MSRYPLLDRALRGGRVGRGAGLPDPAARRPRDDATLWVIHRSTAWACIVLTFLAGFMCGAAAMAWVVLH